MKKLTLLFLAMTSLLFSCTKEKTQNSSAIEKINANRLMIREKIKLHSAGLRYFYNALNEVSLKTKSTLPQEPFPQELIDQLTPQNVKSTIISFLDQNNIAQTKELAILSNDFVDFNTEVVSLPDLDFKFSTNFYKIGLQIINTAGENLNEINSNIDAILNSSDFLSLSEIEQNILISSAETYIDSFTYWSQNDLYWNTLSSTYTGNKTPVVTKAGGKGWRHYAREDAKGAVAGGISGALGGALLGTAAGGAGAGPGALLGFVGGAITGGVGNSILAYLNNTIMMAKPIEEREKIIEKVVTLDNLVVPEIWTKAAFNSDVPIPVKIEFRNGVMKFID